jgi:hypothetical protein
VITFVDLIPGPSLCLTFLVGPCTACDRVGGGIELGDCSEYWGVGVELNWVTTVELNWVTAVSTGASELAGRGPL